MNDEMLTIAEIGRLCRRSEGAIRTAIWRHRRDGVELGFPPPMLIGGRYRWMSSVVIAHLEQLSSGSTAAGAERARATKFFPLPKAADPHSTNQGGEHRELTANQAQLFGGPKQ